MIDFLLSTAIVASGTFIVYLWTFRNMPIVSWIWYYRITLGFIIWRIGQFKDALHKKMHYDYKYELFNMFIRIS